MKTESASLAQIEAETKRFADAHTEVSDIVSDLESQIQAVKRTFMTRLRNAVGRAAERQHSLFGLIESAPGLFVKPRTYIFHGIKVGMAKQKGKIEITDPDKTVDLIEKHFPEQAEVLIDTTKVPVKKAIEGLTVDQLKKIGCQVTDPDDAVVIKPTDGEIEKAVQALLKDATEDLDQQAAA